MVKEYVEAVTLRDRLAAELRALLGASVRARLIRCGRSVCACAKDPRKMHGPYLYVRYLDENGVKRERYLPPEFVPRGIDAARFQKLKQDYLEAAHRAHLLRVELKEQGIDPDQLIREKRREQLREVFRTQPTPTVHG